MLMRKFLDMLPRINLRLAAAAFCAVAILHIVATLAAPELAPSRAYEMISQELPLNTMQILPAVTPSTQRLPFMAPDARYALCRFDTKDGAVSLTATLPGPGWVVALYSTAGDNFFTSVAQPGRRSEVSLLLVPSDERFKGLTPEAKGAQSGPEDPMLTVPAQTGVAVIRAPEQGQAYRSRNLAELKRARCAFRSL
jgi:uncharacterized membrane protein